MTKNLTILMVGLFLVGCSEAKTPTTPSAEAQNQMMMGPKSTPSADAKEEKKEPEEKKEEEKKPEAPAEGEKPAGEAKEATNDAK